ncbi:MAG: transcriptional regulator [Acidimicrobiales bacterium]|nr:MAG: transcriptional regulator [Acidimicrobiales bacterium]
MKKGVRSKADLTQGTVFDPNCPVRDVLSHIATRWGVLIVAALNEGPRRYFELKARIGGISEKMLAQTLRLLTRDGIVERDVEPSSPPKVTYTLTALGRELANPLHQLLERIQACNQDVTAAQLAYDHAPLYTESQVPQ